MEFANHLIFAAGLLFLVSILATAITPRLGVPLLLVFIVIGMLAGQDGPGHIVFEDFHLANLAGTAALVVILFDGGMRTSFKTFRVALWPALSLATVGVALTTIIVGGFCAWLLKLPLAAGMLLGAIVSSTDAAAVFSLLHNKAVVLNERVTSVLEIESGTNDPMAIFLTIGLLTYLESHGQFGATGFAVLLAKQLGIGGALGIGGGWALQRALNRLVLSESLYPVLALFSSFLLFGLTSLVGGSGFLAVYLAGLIIGNRRVRAMASIRRFHDGIAWMAQIGMFLILGLLVNPHQLPAVAIPALLIALVLILVARPLSVLLSLLPFRLPWREQAFISWVGLRGSVPIVLATFPWLVGVPNAGLIFNITFFIVLVSLIVQGWSVQLSARLLDLLMPRTQTRIHRMDIDLPGQRGYEIVSYRLPESSAHLGKKPKELPVRDHSRVISISREGRMLAYREWGALQAGDYISLLAAEADLEKLDAVFQIRRPHGKLPGAQQFFGEFTITPEAPARDLADSYNIPLPEGTEQSTVAQLVLRFLPRPVTGDRLRLGPVELVVRSMSGREITGIGIRLPRE
ncbi:MAG: potassium/proton antiporter [Stenotrophobium sp.]